MKAYTQHSYWALNRNKKYKKADVGNTIEKNLKRTKPLVMAFLRFAHHKVRKVSLFEILEKNSSFCIFMYMSIFFAFLAVVKVKCADRKSCGLHI